MDSRIPRRDLLRAHVDVVDVAAHACRLACECKLSVSLSQGPLGLLSLADIDGHIDYTDNGACRVTERCGIRYNRDPSAVRTLKNGLQTLHAFPLPQGNFCRTIRESRRLSIGAIGSREVGPPILPSSGLL